MKHSIRISLRMYYRSIKLFVPYLAMLAAACFSFIKIFSGTTTAISFLQSSLKLGVLGFLYFSFASFEFTSQLRHLNGREAILVVRSAESNLIFSQIFVLILPLILWTILILGWQFAFCLHGQISSSSYLWHCFLAVALYCFFPGLAGILFGACLFCASQPLAYGSILLGCILSSPIPLQLLSGGTIGNFSFASALDWFALSVPNSSFIADGVYGISVEFSRWVLIAFWCLSLLSILLWILDTAKCHRMRSVAMLVGILALLCGIRFAFRTNDFILYKDVFCKG